MHKDNLNALKTGNNIAGYVVATSTGATGHYNSLCDSFFSTDF